MTDQVTLPPLPDPGVIWNKRTGDAFYTAEQMQAYARAALAKAEQRQEAWQLSDEHVKAVFKALDAAKNGGVK